MDEILNVTWGPYGKGIVPSVLYQAYRVPGAWNSDDESLWYTFEPGENIEPSTIEIVNADDSEETYGNIIANKYGTPKCTDVVDVTITLSEGLTALYPGAIVSIDGKEYDLGVLATVTPGEEEGDPDTYTPKELSLYMDHDHRISIFWAPGLVETFRVVALR